MKNFLGYSSSILFTVNFYLQCISVETKFSDSPLLQRAALVQAGIKKYQNQMRNIKLFRCFATIFFGIFDNCIIKKCKIMQCILISLFKMMIIPKLHCFQILVRRNNCPNAEQLNNFPSVNIFKMYLQLVVSDLRSQTKGSRFDSGCQLCAEVSSLQ